MQDTGEVPSRSLSCTALLCAVPCRGQFRTVSSSEVLSLRWLSLWRSLFCISYHIPMVSKPRHQTCEQKPAINFGKSLYHKAKVPFPSCTLFCKPFPPRIQRFCSITAVAQALEGQWGGVVAILWSCFLPSAELRLSLLPLKRRGKKKVLVVPVYIDWLYAEELVFCMGPQT